MTSGDDGAGSNPQLKALVEIRQLVEEGMGRFGLAGELEIDPQWLILHGHGSPAHVEIGHLLEQWPTLPYETRQKRCHELVRRLQQQRHSSLVPSLPHRQTSGNNVIKIVLIAAAAVGLSAVVVALTRGMTPFSEKGADEAQAGAAATEFVPGTVAEYEAERSARALRVCQATQSRIMRGATVGPTDVEGWLVELLVFARGVHDWAAHPGLAQMVAAQDGGAHRVVWASTPELSQAEGPDTRVNLERFQLTAQAEQAAGAAGAGAKGSNEYSGLHLTFRGRYVTPYFREEERISYVRLANAVLDAVGGDHGALFARCDRDRSHHLGAWFRAPSPGAAAAVMLYVMGAHAETPHLRGNLMSLADDGSFDPGYTWAQLSSITAPLKRERIATLFGSQGGMLSGKSGDDTTIVTFPFRDANRAERSSFILAQELGIAVRR